MQGIVGGGVILWVKATYGNYEVRYKGRLKKLKLFLNVCV
jgi:hypothetical protein